MTTIIGMKTEKGALLVADRRANVSGRSETLAEPKVFPAGELLIGYSGTLRAAQALRHHLSLRERAKGETPMQYVAGFVAGEIMVTLAHHVGKSDDRAEVIVACGGEIYVIYSEGSVVAPSRGYDAIGSGQDYALAAMYANRHMADPRLRLWKAMEAAAEFDLYTGTPFEFFELAASEKDASR